MPRSRHAALACSLALTAATVLLPGAHAVAAPAAIVHVAPDGDDANPGTEAQPVRTLTRARDLVRGRNQGMTGDLTVRLAGGTYRLPPRSAWTGATPEPMATASTGRPRRAPGR